MSSDSSSPEDGNPVHTGSPACPVNLRLPETGSNGSLPGAEDGRIAVWWGETDG